MKYKTIFLPTFVRDIYVAEANMVDFPKKAQNTFGALDRKIQALSEMPQMCPLFLPYPQYRKMHVEDYIVLYSVKDEEKRLYFHRLLPARMDIENQLSKS
jgi:mRNA-degrading endonuclease RelE of RelBE toxin-antitoxin system